MIASAITIGIVTLLLLYISQMLPKEIALVLPLLMICLDGCVLWTASVVFQVEKIDLAGAIMIGTLIKIIIFVIWQNKQFTLTEKKPK